MLIGSRCTVCVTARPVHNRLTAAQLARHQDEANKLSRAAGLCKTLQEEQAYATSHSMAAMQTALHTPSCSGTLHSAAHLMSCMAAAMAADGATSALVNTTATGTSRAMATARCSRVTLDSPVMGQTHSSTWSGSCRAQEGGSSQVRGAAGPSRGEGSCNTMSGSCRALPGACLRRWIGLQRGTKLSVWPQPCRSCVPGRVAG